MSLTQEDLLKIFLPIIIHKTACYLYIKKENTNEYYKSIRSYFAPSEFIDGITFSDVNGYYNYPTVTVGESFARILLIEFEDGLTKAIRPE